MLYWLLLKPLFLWKSLIESFRWISYPTLLLGSNFEEKRSTFFNWMSFFTRLLFGKGYFISEFENEAKSLFLFGAIKRWHLIGFESDLFVLIFCFHFLHLKRKIEALTTWRGECIRRRISIFSDSIWRKNVDWLSKAKMVINVSEFSRWKYLGRYSKEKYGFPDIRSLCDNWSLWL